MKIPLLPECGILVTGIFHFLSGIRTEKKSRNRYRTNLVQEKKSKNRCQKNLVLKKTQKRYEKFGTEKVQSRREREIQNSFLQFREKKEKPEIPFPSFER